jgi:superfamily II RNA helicase
VWNRKAPIMVMTTEILRNMLYERCHLPEHFLALFMMLSYGLTL